MNGSGNKAARLQNLAVLPICVHAWCKQPWEWYQGLFVPPHWQDNIKANIRQAGLIGLPLWWLRHSNFHICCLKWGCKNCHVFFDKFNSGPTKSLKSWQSTCAEHVLQAIACICWPLYPPFFLGGGGISMFFIRDANFPEIVGNPEFLKGLKLTSINPNLLLWIISNFKQDHNPKSFKAKTLNKHYFMKTWCMNHLHAQLNFNCYFIAVSRR